MLLHCGLLIIVLGAPQKSQPAGFVIDFAPGKWTPASIIKVRVEAKDGSKFERTYRVSSADASPSLVRDLIEASVGEFGWEAKADAKAGLTIRGHKSMGKSALLVECRVEVSDAPDANQPKVSRIHE